jgi:hypothetical protein
MKRMRQEYAIGVGAATLLTILVVLCLAALSVMAFSGAQGDAALTARSAGMTEAYYQASDRAQRALAALDGALLAARRAARDQAEYDKRLSSIRIDDVSLAFEAGIFTFSIDAGGRALTVSARACALGDAQRYALTQYALSGSELWMGEAADLKLYQ